MGAVVTKSIGPGEMRAATAAVAVVDERKRDPGKIMAMAKEFLARAKKKITSYDRRRRRSRSTTRAPSLLR